MLALLVIFCFSVLFPPEESVQVYFRACHYYMKPSSVHLDDFPNIVTYISSCPSYAIATDLLWIAERDVILGSTKLASLSEAGAKCLVLVTTTQQWAFLPYNYYGFGCFIPHETDSLVLLEECVAWDNLWLSMIMYFLNGLGNFRSQKWALIFGCFHMYTSCVGVGV